MNARSGYSEHFIKKMLGGLKLSTIEKALIASLVLMCAIIAVDTMTGRDVGNYEQLKMVKAQAQQELMALKNQDN